jgi:hypothetical protein
MDNSHDTLKIDVHTDGEKHIHLLGLNTFLKKFRIINGCIDKILFTGKKAPDPAFP